MPSPRPLSKINAAYPEADKLFAALVEKSGEATIGSLVKGLIHNLNGGVQILAMQMEMLQRMVVKEGEIISSPIHEQINQCLAQIDQFKALIEELVPKEMIEDQEEPQMIHLNELLKNLLSLFRNNLFFKHQVRVEKYLTALPPFKGYYHDFSQSFINLISNAVEAMENSPDKVLTLITEKIGDRLQVSIKDTGCGLPEEKRSYLFSPFFTTKGGKHKGLGLFVVKELLSKYAASIDYSFQEGETVFRVTFPLHYS
ncbi:MAG: sensor histidine kinase [Thermodesulfobacteriota bacterium]